ncbi:MAG: hypothetical protein ACREKR_02910 [Candidatus Methylomirabilales bacterium]
MRQRLLQRVLPVAFCGLVAISVAPALAEEAPRGIGTTSSDLVSVRDAEPQRAIVNLRGDQVLVPGDVPPKDRFILQRLISVDDRLIVFLYSDPGFQERIDYVEAYNANGELLEIAWYDSTSGPRIVRDVNLGNRDAKRPARILKTPVTSVAIVGQTR